MHVSETSKQRYLDKYEARRDEQNCGGESGLVVVHFTLRFLSGWIRVLVSSMPNYAILQQSKMKVVNIEVNVTKLLKD